jgi:hypothetical protein
MLLSHGSAKEEHEAFHGKIVAFLTGKYTYFGLGETALIRL